MHGLCLLLLLVFPASFVAATRASSPEQQIFELLNQERDKVGEPKLQWDDRLAQAAREHSNRMVDWNAIGHQFPGEPGVAERIGSTGARFTQSAENVAKSFSPEEAHAALMTSPGHRENILSEKYDAVGIGVVDHDGHLFVTEDFAKVVPAYSEQQFAEAVVAAFNAARRRNGQRKIDVRFDSQLHGLACSTNPQFEQKRQLSSFGHELMMFTLSEPDKLPEQVVQKTLDKRPRTLDLGVCFKPDAQYGYANFWVAVVLHP